MTYTAMQGKKRLEKNKQSLRNFGTILKSQWSPDKLGERDLGKKHIWLKKKKQSPNLFKYINLQIQEAQQFRNRINAKKTTSRHNIIKWLQTKYKEKSLKSS